MSVIFVRIETNLHFSLIYIKIPAVPKILMKLLSAFFELLREERQSKEKSMNFRNFFRNTPRTLQISWRHFLDCAA